MSSAFEGAKLRVAAGYAKIHASLRAFLYPIARQAAEFVGNANITPYFSYKPLIAGKCASILGDYVTRISLGLLLGKGRHQKQCQSKHGIYSEQEHSGIPGCAAAGKNGRHAQGTE